MTLTLRHLLDALNTIAPQHLAEPWDSVGLMVGSPEQPVSSVLIGLDPTTRLIDEAMEVGADVVITHHPFLFKPLRVIDPATPVGRFLSTALRGGIAVVAAHTNLDRTSPGVSDRLAELLDLERLVPLIAEPGAETYGSGRLGEYPHAITGTDFITKLTTRLQLPAVYLAGTLPERIAKVAVCGGSGSEYAPEAKLAGADCFVTAEIKHHIGCWAVECNFCIIDATHFATERPAVSLLVELLQHHASARAWPLVIAESRREISPLTLMYHPEILKKGEQP
jgi:dinuclear metal center YbgI/SA1388 family protein